MFYFLISVLHEKLLPMFCTQHTCVPEEIGTSCEPTPAHMHPIFYPGKSAANSTLLAQLEAQRKVSRFRNILMMFHIVLLIRFWHDFVLLPERYSACFETSRTTKCWKYASLTTIFPPSAHCHLFVQFFFFFHSDWFLIVYSVSHRLQ